MEWNDDILIERILPAVALKFDLYLRSERMKTFRIKIFLSLKFEDLEEYTKARIPNTMCVRVCVCLL